MLKHRPKVPSPHGSTSRKNREGQLKAGWIRSEVKIYRLIKGRENLGEFAYVLSAKAGFVGGEKRERTLRQKGEEKGGKMGMSGAILRRGVRRKAKRRDQWAGGRGPGLNIAESGAVLLSGTERASPRDRQAVKNPSWVAAPALLAARSAMAEKRAGEGPSGRPRGTVKKGMPLSSKVMQGKKELVPKRYLDSEHESCAPGLCIRPSSNASEKGGSAKGRDICGQSRTAVEKKSAQVLAGSRTNVVLYRGRGEKKQQQTAAQVDQFDRKWAGRKRLDK